MSSIGGGWGFLPVTMTMTLICYTPVFPFTHYTDAKDSRPVQVTAVPAGTKASKLQPAKTADKGKKQAAVKKTDINTTAESVEDKKKQTKPQVTHELSVVRLLMLKKYCFYINFVVLQCASLVCM